jgi:integrase
MAKKPRGPVGDPPPNLRQRQRSDGTWRIWWEATPTLRKLGFATIELDAAAPLKAARQARDLNAAVDQARITGKPPAARRGLPCVEDVVDDYRRGVHYLESLAPKTRISYDKGLRLIVTKWGDVPVADFTKPMARTWYESLHREAGKWQAPALIRLLSIVMNHAELRGWRPENSNPCMRLGVSIPKARTRVVDWPEFDALRAAAARVGLPSMGLAMALSYLAGQRETDVMLAERRDFAQVQVRWAGSDTDATVWVWRLDRSKTGAAGTILLHDELAPMVAAVLARPAPDDARLVVEERLGCPYAEDLFQSRFGEIRAAAIAAGCTTLASMQFRDLRRSFSVHARRGGASPADAGDVLGNSAATNARIKGTYMPPEFATAARAVSAVARPKPERKEA